MTHHAPVVTERPTLRGRAVALVERFHWLHTSLGLLGNLCFFVGSVLFLWESAKLVGIWLFIVGSLGMLLGSLGDAVVKLEGDQRGS
jgi:hypothetical protein